ncbi:MAG: DUF1109 family protein, partial [Proteobacteria bacterium]|nr:DUF1109 family protein [Pseudomonadota bacterium]
SASVAATFYALQCTDDSPLFLATWYLPAMAASTVLGALLGRRQLQW